MSAENAKAYRDRVDLALGRFGNGLVTAYSYSIGLAKLTILVQCAGSPAEKSKLLSVTASSCLSLNIIHLDGLAAP